MYDFIARQFKLTMKINSNKKNCGSLKMEIKFTYNYNVRTSNMKYKHFFLFNLVV